MPPNSEVLDQNAVVSGETVMRGDISPPPPPSGTTTAATTIVEPSLAALECLVRFLGVWTTKFPYDFRDERIMSHVKHIVAK